MPSCAVPNCDSTRRRGFRFFRFPSDKTRREKWVNNVGRENWDPTESSRICNTKVDSEPSPIHSLSEKSETAETKYLLVENELITTPGKNEYLQLEEEQQDYQQELLNMDKQKSLCRLCLTPSPVQRLISSDESKMLEEIASIELSRNAQLNKACIKCLVNLKLAFQIQQRIIKSNNWFIENIDAEVVGSNSCEIITIKQESLDGEVILDSANSNTEISGSRIKEEHSDKRSTNDTDSTAEILVLKTEKDVVEEKSLFADFNLGKCPICGKDNSTVEHAQSHFESIHKCETCDTSFKNIQEYSLHMTKKHGTQNQTCPHCDLCFKYETLYKIHISLAHQKKVKLKSQMSQVRSISKVSRRPSRKSNSSAIQWVHCRSSMETEPAGGELRGELHDCAECGRSFFDEQQYLRHIKVHDKITCPICKREITRYNYSRHYALHGPGMPQLVCEICGSVCKNKGSLRTHIYYTHSQRSLPCEHCDKVFRKKYDLVMHTKKEHTGERNHVCDICGKKYFTRHKLNSHVKILHLKERKFVCRFCDKSLSSRHSLRTHERQHTNESPYKCEICGEGFRQNVSLRWHRKSKHNCIEEKTEECKVCGKKFVNIFAVKSHMRMHDP
ncbi:unnamed protein product [Acanthoscelides obtectus]|uniref:Uncharacterized protein n=1 Tax=Acanthoscelides obtectus TaxID=200917 RepID=A0A9P0KF05_ACAOB|nr:unnamed protein product [Acanthoscelides obtectus]CAK1620657.1 Zinc finger protein 569 [Acanthoscelides obtectus]